MTQQKDENKNIWAWNIDETELKDQVVNYNNLKITESYRGISSLIVIAILALTFFLSLLEIGSSLEEFFYGLILYIPLVFFVYKGHRWAIVSLMILWTLEKGYQLIEMGGVAPLIWWVIITPYFYRALKVENEKRKTKSSHKNTPELLFCHKCGAPLEPDSVFCSSCGEKVISADIK